MTVFASFAFATALQTSLSAQQSSSNSESFVNVARMASERYQDRSNAVRDGYRLVGGDFPGMGEHWVNVAAVLRGAPLESGSPQLLAYIYRDGEPLLVGVGYAVMVGEGELAPPFPQGVSEWHEHSHSVGDETLEMHSMAPGAAGGTRLALMHAWVWTPNPDGLFERNNWSLPFVRLGLAPSSVANHDVAQALSLLTHGGTYYTERLKRGNLSATDEGQHKTLTAAVETVRRIVDAAGRDGIDADALAAVWRGSATMLLASVPTRPDFSSA